MVDGGSWVADECQLVNSLSYVVTVAWIWCLLSKKTLFLIYTWSISFNYDFALLFSITQPINNGKTLTTMLKKSPWDSFMNTFILHLNTCVNTLLWQCWKVSADITGTSFVYTTKPNFCGEKWEKVLLYKLINSCKDFVSSHGTQFLSYLLSWW